MIKLLTNQELNIYSGTCSDGIQNQGELSIDCGGPCKACSGMRGFLLQAIFWRSFCIEL